MQFVPGSWRANTKNAQLRPLNKDDLGDSSLVRPHTSDASLMAQPDMVRAKSDAILQEAKLKKEPVTNLVWTHNDLISICETSFNQCFRSVGTDIVKEVKEEIHRSIISFRKEIAGGMQTLEGGREKVTAMMLAEMRSEFDKIREEGLEAQREAQRSQETILVNLKEKTRQEIMEYFRVGNQDYQKQVIDRLTELSQSIGEVSGQAESHSNQIQILRDSHSNEIQILQDKSESLAEAQNNQVADLTKQVAEVRAAQIAHSQGADGTLERIDTELSKYFSAEKMKGSIGFDDLVGQITNTHKKVNANVGVVLGEIGSIHADVGVVLGEIGRIQKAMHMDFVMDLSGYAPREGRRVREYGLQTDPPQPKDVVEFAVQTTKVGLNDEGAQTLETGEPKQDGMAQLLNILPAVAKKKKHHKRNSLSRHKPPKPIPPKHLLQKKTKVFADADAMKQKARQALMKPQFNVLNLYKQTGWTQFIARHPLFEQITFMIIFLNAIWIAIDMDMNDATIVTEAHPVFIIAENVFCAYFTMEVMIRFFAFEKKRNCLLDYWFLFDSALVILMVLETWVIMIVMAALDSDSSVDFLGNLSILRMARLIKIARMARLARLLRAIPELVVLIKGILVAFRSVFLVFLLWLIIIYFYAMVFRQITHGEDVGDKYFETVPDAMNTLLLNCILPEIASIVHEISGEMPILWPIILSFILLTSLTIANMLVGVLVGVVGAVAETEKEGMLVSTLVYEIKLAFHHLSRDPQAIISKTEFEALLVEPEIALVIKNAGVDVVTLLDMSEMIFEKVESDNPSKDGLCFEDFIDLVLSMRGTNPATVKDVKEHLKVVKTIMLESSSNLMSKIDTEFAQIQNLMAEQMQDLRADLASEDSEGSDVEGSYFPSGSPSPSPSTATSRTITLPH